MKNYSAEFIRHVMMLNAELAIEYYKKNKLNIKLLAIDTEAVLRYSAILRNPRLYTIAVDIMILSGEVKRELLIAAEESALSIGGKSISTFRKVGFDFTYRFKKALDNLDTTYYENPSVGFLEGVFSEAKTNLKIVNWLIPKIKDRKWIPVGQTEKSMVRLASKINNTEFLNSNDVYNFLILQYVHQM